MMLLDERLKGCKVITVDLTADANMPIYQVDVEIFHLISDGREKVRGSPKSL